MAGKEWREAGTGRERGGGKAGHVEGVEVKAAGCTGRKVAVRWGEMTVAVGVGARGCDMCRV